MLFRLLFLSIAAALALAPPVTTSNLIVNGSFEQSSINPGSFKDVPAGSTAISGWTVTLKHIDYIGGLWVASDGKRSLDLEGSVCNTRSSTDCLGGVEQTFATVAGHDYNVSFDLAGNLYSGPKVKTIKVSAAGKSQTFTFDITGHNTAKMGWKTEQWTFTATSTSTTLEFDSADNVPNVSGWGPALDNVIVTAK
jgi:choice-of-anchor C domain-containing protein